MAEHGVAVTLFRAAEENEHHGMPVSTSYQPLPAYIGLYSCIGYDLYKKKNLPYQ
jgi:hypothetical protein